MTELANQPTAELGAPPAGDVDALGGTAIADGALEDEIAAGMSPDVDDQVDDQVDDDDELDDPLEQARRQELETEALMEDGLKKAEREAIAHAERLAKYFGPLFGNLVPCPLCPPILAGWRFPVPPDKMDPAQVAAVRTAIGLPEFSNLHRDTYAGTCDKCEGLGQVLSGSQVRGKEALTCYQCKGRGGMPTATARAADADQAAAPVQTTDSQHEPASSPQTDPWGRPSSHVGYMVMPYEGMPDHLKP